jgi:hypothetical protein
MDMNMLDLDRLLGVVACQERKCFVSSGEGVCFLSHIHSLKPLDAIDVDADKLGQLHLC